MANNFIAGVGKALIFKGQNLIGVASTLTESTFNFSITAEEIRGGAGNALYGKYFHDSNLGVTLTDSMFNMNYIAASLGVNITSGGISVAEESQAVVAAGGSVTLTNTAIAFDGTLIGWYKLPTDTDWTIGTITNAGAVSTMTIPNAVANTTYCVKYYYQNTNAESITIPVQYVPAELHVTILNDIYSGNISSGTDNPIVGRLITDIPRLQLDGNQDLSLTATGAATVSLSGSALAVTSADSCTDTPYYGTMTQELTGETWQSKVKAIAIANGDVELSTSGTETLMVYVTFGNGMASALKDNSNFTFAVENTPTPTATDVAVSVAGVITAGAQTGNAIISVTLKNAPAGVEPAFVSVTVS